MVSVNMLFEFLNSWQGWITLTAVGVAVGIWLYDQYANQKNQFEGKDIEETIRDEAYKLIHRGGMKAHKRFTKEWGTIGLVYKRDVVDAPVFEDSKHDGETYTVKKDDDGNIVTTKALRLLIYKDKLVHKLAVKVKPLRKKFCDVYVMSTDNVYDDPDRIHVKPGVDFRPIGGVFVDRSDAALNHALSFAWSEVLEDDLERHTNWIKYYNWRERNQSEEMQIMEKENELKSRFFDRRDRSQVEQD